MLRDVAVVPVPTTFPPVEVVRAGYDLRAARASRRELHHKSHAAAQAARASLAEARRAGTPAAARAAAYTRYEYELGVQRRLGACHRLWTAIAAFLAGQPYRSVEPRSPYPAPSPNPLNAWYLATTILEVARDSAIRIDRKAAPSVAYVPARHLATYEALDALRRWLEAAPAQPTQPAQPAGAAEAQ